MFHQNRLKLLSWVVRSPDLSPIENILNVVGRPVRQNLNRIRNEDEIWELVKTVWTDIL